MKIMQKCFQQTQVLEQTQKQINKKMVHKPLVNKYKMTVNDWIATEKLKYF